MKNKQEKKKNGLIVIGVLLAVSIILAIVFGNPFGSNSNKTGCLEKGMFQSSSSYCIDICMLNKSDTSLNWDVCENLCNTREYVSGDAGLAKLIQNYKCSKCGECKNED